MSVALVTDSTASLTPETVAACGITVVPLQVVIGTSSYDEGCAGGATSDLLAEALRGKLPVSTSRPNPDEMLSVYRGLAYAGAEQVVAVHLSGNLSGTFESAQLAARHSPIPVIAVDSRQVGMGTGFAVLAAARAIEDGLDADGVAEAARERARATTSLFYVDTLEYLRRGGRVGAIGALVGSALAMKPILRVDDDGNVRPHERVRTAGKALARLADLAVQAAGEAEVDVAVEHLACAERAEELASGLAERLEPGLGGRSVEVGEIGAVLGAHVGPGMVAVVVAPRT